MGRDTEEIVRLGIALDYAAKWNFERTLRDLIQNFYDSIGMYRFAEEFHYDYVQSEKSEYRVTMSAIDHPFNYEWLVYIGGSTKTDDSEEYIGQYGEGFKICMLNLIRFGISDVTMHSQDWEIRPAIYLEKVGNEEVRMLGYSVRKTLDDNVTSLVIDHIPQKYLPYLEEALLHFFYSENPLFGEELVQNKKFAIYRGNGKRIPCHQSIDFSGILYKRYLARGRLPFPLFILSKDRSTHSGHGENRNRKMLDDQDIVADVYKISRQLSPKISLEALIVMKDLWNEMPQAQGRANWYYPICQLVRNISTSEQYTARFIKEYPNLAYIDRKGPDRKKNALITQVTVWARTNNTKRIVNPIFRMLGAQSLMDQFVKEYSVGLRKPAGTEKERAKILYCAYKEVLPQKWTTDSPEILIGTLNQSRQAPAIFAERDYSAKAAKIHRKYRISRLIMTEQDFKSDSFNKTLVFYCETMLHIFGSSKSARLNAILTELGKYFIENASEIAQYRKEWEEAAIVGE